MSIAKQCSTLGPATNGLEAETTTNVQNFAQMGSMALETLVVVMFYRSHEFGHADAAAVAVADIAGDRNQG